MHFIFNFIELCDKVIGSVTRKIPRSRCTTKSTTSMCYSTIAVWAIKSTIQSNFKNLMTECIS